MATQRLAYTAGSIDEEWLPLAPLLPPKKPGGRPRKYPVHDISNGIQEVLRSGCAWRQDGTWIRLHDQLHDMVHTRLAGRRQHSGAIPDARAVKTTEPGARTATTARSNATAAPPI